MSSAPRSTGFTMSDWDFDESQMEARLRYRCETFGEFEERISFPDCTMDDSVDRAAVEAACELLHLMAGVSYIKAGAATRLSITPPVPSVAAGDLTERTYDAGMREFCVRNDLPIPMLERIVFDGGVAIERPGDAVDDVDGVGDGRPGLIPFGAGLDSTMVAHVFDDCDLLTVNPTSHHRAAAEQFDRRHLIVRREIDRTDVLTQAPALNGHVPITAVVSAITVLAAVLGGHGAVILANERSSDEPTTLSDTGSAVNHQWSKSAEFEVLFQRALHSSRIPVDYFSALRNVSDRTIGQFFGEHPDLVSRTLSCNRAFRGSTTGGEAPVQDWCGVCDKCRSSFLTLAPHLPPDDLIRVLGFNPFATGVDGDDLVVARLWDAEAKPFECVTTAADAAGAVVSIGDDPSWASAGPSVQLVVDATRFLAGHDPHVTPREFDPVTPRRYAERIAQLERPPTPA